MWKVHLKAAKGLVSIKPMEGNESSNIEIRRISSVSCRRKSISLHRGKSLHPTLSTAYCVEQRSAIPLLILSNPIFCSVSSSILICMSFQCGSELGNTVHLFKYPFETNEICRSLLRLQWRWHRSARLFRRQPCGASHIERDYWGLQRLEGYI